MQQIQRDSLLNIYCNTISPTGSMTSALTQIERIKCAHIGHAEYEASRRNASRSTRAPHHTISSSDPGQRGTEGLSLPRGGLPLGHWFMLNLHISYLIVFTEETFKTISENRIIFQVMFMDHRTCAF